MARDWAATFDFWGASPSKTELERCDRAEQAVRKAIAASDKLKSLGLEVFVQGSYANGTNVRQDSDVDICVLYKDTFFTDYSHTPEIDDTFLGFVSGSAVDYGYTEYKTDIEAALVSYFGRPAVRKGKKAFDIRENTYRVDADVVPCFEHRLYAGNRSKHWSLRGTELHPTAGGGIVNWPKQNKDNGVFKDDGTNGEFKAVTRVLKNLRFQLIEDGEALAQRIPSYLIECLVYRTDRQHLTHATRYDNVRNTIAWLWGQTKTDQLCSEWTEINDIKYLFHASQPWKRADVHAFMLLAWNYIGFK